MPNNAWGFAARMTYEGSGRTFTMDLNREYNVEVEEASWSPFGGTSVGIYANDGTRDVQVSFGIEKFVETFGEAIERFCRLEIDYPGNGESAIEKLEDRNAFLRDAKQRYPAILMQITRTLKRLSDETERAAMRMATLKLPEG